MHQIMMSCLEREKRGGSSWLSGVGVVCSRDEHINSRQSVGVMTWSNVSSRTIFLIDSNHFIGSSSLSCLRDGLMGWLQRYLECIWILLQDLFLKTWPFRGHISINRINIFRHERGNQMEESIKRFEKKLHHNCIYSQDEMRMRMN